MQRGFTLIELLIVLGLILVIMGLSLAPFQRMRARSQLGSNAQKLQAELYATRLTAMKAGTPYVFRYQGGTGVYEILPKSVLDERTPKSAVGEIPQVRAVGTGPDPSAPFSSETGVAQPVPSSYLRELPNQCVFGFPPVSHISTPAAETTGELGLARSVGTDFPIPQESQVPQPVWSEPVFFYPNGRTSSAALVVQSTGDYLYCSELTLRGLTGTARVGKVKLVDDY